MSKITIEIPNGILRTEGDVIDMAPDSAGNWLYIKTDEGPLGAPAEPFVGKIGATLRFSVETV